MSAARTEAQKVAAVCSEGIAAVDGTIRFRPNVQTDQRVGSDLSAFPRFHSIAPLLGGLHEPRRTIPRRAIEPEAHPANGGVLQMKVLREGQRRLVLAWRL